MITKHTVKNKGVGTQPSRHTAQNTLDFPSKSRSTPHILRSSDPLQTKPDEENVHPAKALLIHLQIHQENLDLNLRNHHHHHIRATSHSSSQRPFGLTATQIFVSPTTSTKNSLSTWTRIFCPLER